VPLAHAAAGTVAAAHAASTAATRQNRLLPFICLSFGKRRHARERLLARTLGGHIPPVIGASPVP
jgi:hypothetical protein